MVSKSRIRRKIRRLERGQTDPETLAVTESTIQTALSWALVDSWTYSAPVTEVDFTGLDTNNEILVFIKGITLGTAGIASLRVSSDNGSTFFSTSGDYNSVSSAGAVAAATMIGLYDTVETSSARSGFLQILAWNQVADKMCFSSRTDSVFWYMSSNVAVALNALRIVPSAGGNITGGSIYIFGR